MSAFQKGRTKTGGRTAGTPNKATVEFKQFWAKFYESDEYRANLQRRIIQGRAGPMEQYVAQMVFGKPKDQVDLQGDITIRHELADE